MSGSVIRGAAGDGDGDDSSALVEERQGPGAVGELLARVAVVLEFVHEEVSTVRRRGGRAEQAGGITGSGMGLFLCRRQEGAGGLSARSGLCVYCLVGCWILPCRRGNERHVAREMIVV